ncbi:hypothetical protein BH09BAC6_BH09BAC6_36190 [soil metagenome]|jgi:hypothetical protein
MYRIAADMVVKTAKQPANYQDNYNNVKYVSHDVATCGGCYCFKNVETLFLFKGPKSFAATMNHQL